MTTNQLIAEFARVLDAQPMLSFNVWVRCETYGTTFSRIVDAMNAAAAVEKYLCDLVARHGLNRRDLAVCLVQPI